MTIKYSLHKITDRENLGFSEVEYSRFKFGDGYIAEEFGKSLAKNFINDELSKHYSGIQLVVVSSPYSFIPTATYFMKNHFIYELNKWLVGNNFPVVQETKMYRSTSYSDDYGVLDASERMGLIGNDSFYIDKVFIHEKLVLFIDDIRITGSHEKMIIKMLSTLSVENNYCLLYFAELVNDLIHPNIENYLNYAYVKSLSSLNDIVFDGAFVLNTRVVKYMLNSDYESFKTFINDKSVDLQNLILNLAIGNSYHQMESYRSNLVYLQDILLATKLK